jgi:hypothetical protein
MEDCLFEKKDKMIFYYFVDEIIFAGSRHRVLTRAAATGFLGDLRICGLGISRHRVMRLSKNALHAAKFVGFFAVVAMIWLTARRPGEAPRYASGEPKITGAFVDGKAEGTWTWWYENGSKMTEGTFTGGRRNGVWQTWYEDGTRKSESTYQGDQLNGTSYQWYPSGVLKQQGNFMNDRRHGVHQYFDTAGRLLEERIFERGTLINR